MLRTFNIPLTWGQLFKRTLRETGNDNVLGLAAQLAYYFLLALVPAIVSVAALVSFLPSTTVQDALNSMGGFAPSALIDVIREQLQNITGGANGGLFTFGLLISIWSSSAAIVGICDALNHAYGIEEGRPWWKVRLTATALTLALAVFVVVSIVLVMVGPTIAEALAARMGLGGAFAMTWKVLQWPVVFALIAFAIGLLYYFGPDAEQDWEWITPGAVLATALWLIASLGFKIYVSSFANYNETYGSLGGVIVLMLWFYLTGMAILVGAEMNAEIEHASPHGKDVGEKVPGEKKKIGAAAARAYQERKKTLAPSEEQPTAPPEEQPTAPGASDEMRHRWAAAAAYGLIGVDVFRSARKGFPQGNKPR